MKVWWKDKRTMNSRKSMRARVRNTNDPNYGGRGIKVDPRWAHYALGGDFFQADMGVRPEGKTLDRRNRNGDYVPGNCGWATPEEQARNRRKSKRPRSRQDALPPTPREEAPLPPPVRWATEVQATTRRHRQHRLAGLFEQDELI
jgi:hypothetical protein